MRKINDNSYFIATLDEINKVAKDDPKKFVETSEGYYQEQLGAAAEMIKNSNGRHQIVLLCGPSSSGKTTTAHKLKAKLTSQGVKASVLSMDNFFIGIKNYPLRPDGKPDMETVETLDIELLNACLRELLTKGKSEFPVFNFKMQARCGELEPIALNEGEVIIMEGIHALNPEIARGLPEDRIFRMYVSVRTKFREEGKTILRPSEIRLVRRMVRDTLFRGYSVKNTIEYWNHVLKSEKLYIDPYRDNVDFKMDTTILYEVCTWHGLLHKKLEAGDWDKFKNYDFMERILAGLRKFGELSPGLIPDSSLLREFIVENKVFTKSCCFNQIILL